ncbi:hypothetical protein LZF95_20680 [Algoriphagus sp. AGSA1]|uniref:hypothetical protein n=1 Tax=Algoriphagus sp. AGSA1 TaxID=2907213 RepID=UPI001F1E340F|nr:hypothetical protein [Algoriphagus sp. AGSA1]MCE7057109.1 hypothetical protein [Algoriphagus sp. AGSA1]
MEEQETSTEQTPKRKSVWNVDKIIGLSAVVVSLAACLLIAYQTFLMREQQLLSVLPHLSLGNEGSYTPNFRYVLSNYGIGPAFIEDIKIIYKGEVASAQDIAAFFIQNSNEIENLHSVLHTNVFPGMLIPAGSDIAIFEVANSKDDAAKLHEVMNSYYKEGLRFEIIYTSVYGERWKITESSLSPEKL